MIEIKEKRITDAIRRQSDVYTETDSLYLQNVTAINGYVLQVLTSEMPALLIPPPNYDEFLITFTQIKSSTLGWVNNVLYKLMEVPQTINQSNEDILRLFKKAASYAEDLKKEYDADDAKLLINKLTTIDEELTFLKNLITDVIKRIKDYDSQLPGLVDDFNQLLQDYKDTVEYDQALMDEYDDKISSLQSEITLLWVEITVEAINAIGAVVMGKLAKKIKNKYVKFFARLATYGLAVGLINDIVNRLIKISVKNGEINVLTEKMGQLEIDIASLTAANIQFEGLRDHISEVNDNLVFIEGKWNDLSNEIKNAIAKIEKAEEDAENKDYKEALDDIIEAKGYWEETVTKSKHLTLDYKVKDAEMEMELLPTEEDSEAVVNEKMKEINRLLDEAKTYSAIEYYNLL